MTVTRRRVLVGAVGLAVLTAAWWATRTPAGVTGSTATRSGGRVASGTGVALVDVPLVDLARLAQAPHEPDDTGRDPFRFGAARPAREAPAISTAAPVRPGSASVSPPPGTGTTAPAGPPPAPPITLRFIGLVRRADGQARIAVLSDNNGVYYGREGDIIEGRYRVGRITDDTVELSYVDGRGRQVVRLAGA